MSYKCEELVKKSEIKKMIDNIDNFDTLEKIEKIIDEEKILVEDFVTELIDGYGNKDVIKNKKATIEEFIYQIRRICLELHWQGNEKKFRDIVPAKDEEVTGWYDLYVDNRYGVETLEIWISENEFLFDPKELAWVIYNMYIGKVVFYL